MSNVLFIGNSYTYYNDLPLIFQAAARACGLEVDAYSVTKGGWRLYQYAFEGDENSALAKEALAARPYAAVFLQDQSLSAIETPKQLLQGAQALAEQAKALGARVILYETWSRCPGHEKLAELQLSPAQMEAAIRRVYADAAHSLGAEISFAGKAMLDACLGCPDICLYAPDGTHPSYAGSYLAACMHLHAYAGLSPRDIPYDGELPADIAARLRACAEGTIRRLAD